MALIVALGAAAGSPAVTAGAAVKTTADTDTRDWEVIIRPAMQGESGLTKLSRQRISRSAEMRLLRR